MSYTFTYAKKPHTNIHLEQVVAVEINSDVIEKMIVSGIEWLQQYPKENLWYTMTGNTLILIVRDEDDPDHLEIEVTERKRLGFLSLADE